MRPMKGGRWLAMLVAVCAAVPSASASPVKVGCTFPEPVLRYSSDRIDVQLTVNYTGCSWWHGRSVNLTGMLERQAVGDPVVEGIGTATGCMGEPVRTPDGHTRVKRVETCSIGLLMGHDELEIATYSGEFNFPWRGGGEIAFSYACSSTPLGASCE